MPRRFTWAARSDAHLLQMRLKDLKLRIAGTWLEDCLDVLDAELAGRGIRIRPHVWLSDEWFSPDNTPGIAIPFYLAHPRLMQLERRMMGDVEGGTPSECLRILRHETGHVMQHAYKLHRRKRWQRLFGRSSVPYPKYYRPDPASRHYVQNLRYWYGQSHPDEDFAETFAVWLKPRSNWRRRYADWPALDKLDYVDALMAETTRLKSTLPRRLKIDPLSQLTMTLGEYYQRKQAHYLTEAPRIYDRELMRLFSGAPKYRNWPAATTFLRQNRTKLAALLARAMGESPVAVYSILDDMILRARELKLRTVGAERQLIQKFVVLFSARTARSLYARSRRQWYAL